MFLEYYVNTVSVLRETIKISTTDQEFFLKKKQYICTYKFKFKKTFKRIFRLNNNLTEQLAVEHRILQLFQPICEETSEDSKATFTLQAAPTCLTMAQPQLILSNSISLGLTHCPYQNLHHIMYTVKLNIVTPKLVFVV